MKNLRAYYSASIVDFLNQSTKEIFGIINSNNINSSISIQQNNTWMEEINILKSRLKDFKEGHIIFEYVIPRVGKRVDVVILHKNIVFLIEFKCGDDKYLQSTNDQVLDYALDIKNFHKESHNKLIIPILLPTEASDEKNIIRIRNKISIPLKANKYNIGDVIRTFSEYFDEDKFDYQEWVNSEYLPTPTIIEAAQALYRGHKVSEITRSDAGAINLTITTDKINKIIEYSKANNKKSICFITGVPGAGKTLVGLNLAIERSKANEGEHAVFISGNFPLVEVLQEALARDSAESSRNKGKPVKKADALRETSSFIQIIHRYRDSFVGNNHIPPERIVIFDEAQRAWTTDNIAKFMKQKKGVLDFQYSEPEFLISTMDRLDGWGVVVCLIGGGQEINTGEAGLPEWFHALRKSFKHWDVYVTPELKDEEYKRDEIWTEMISDLKVKEVQDLHLASSIRSFRTPDLASFIKNLLDANTTEAKRLFYKIKDKYPIVITRDINKAKQWLKSQCQGTTRYGMLASSGAIRLKPSGIFIKNKISVSDWFLNDKHDIRSSYFLEDVVSEFDIQGLELDYTLVAWDADYRFDGLRWTYNNFIGNRWNQVNSEDNKLYLKNAYRVLLTRARQGMVIFLPHGDDNDVTRKHNFYDKTYEYLKLIGIQEI